jgi:preprotein translocase subunit SecG
MLYYLLVIFYILVCFLLLVVVLLQQGKGGDIAAAFGGASSQTAFGARAGATVLTRATAVLGALFMVLSLGLALISRTGGVGGSVVSGVAAPAEPAPLPTGTLPTTAPAGAPAATPPAAAPATPPATPPVEKGKSGK